MDIGRRRALQINQPLIGRAAKKQMHIASIRHKRTINKHVATCKQRRDITIFRNGFIAISCVTPYSIASPALDKADLPL